MSASGPSGPLVLKILSGISSECQTVWMDPDQDQLSVNPDLGLKCLQRLSAGNTKQRDNMEYENYRVIY